MTFFDLVTILFTPTQRSRLIPFSNSDLVEFLLNHECRRFRKLSMERQVLALGICPLWRLLSSVCQSS